MSKNINKYNKRDTWEVSFQQGPTMIEMPIYIEGKRNFFRYECTEKE